jgi:hypothetical protein
MRCFASKPPLPRRFASTFESLTLLIYVQNVPEPASTPLSTARDTLHLLDDIPNTSRIATNSRGSVSMQPNTVAAGTSKQQAGPKEKKATALASILLHARMV